MDLSLITQSLVTLLKTHIEASSVWPTGNTLSVVPDPPDKLDGDNTLGVYLYHVQEDPFNKNLQSDWNRPAHIRYNPMPLQLFYMLSAHSGLNSPVGTFREQLIMGCALKALHDFPVIDDTTQVSGTVILPAILQDKENRLQIEMRPVSADEAVQYWTAGSSPLRLAAYYQLSIVMLDPEEPPSRAGRVLVYNVFAFPGETPHLSSSSNVLSFSLPDEGTPREVTLRPAQVPFGDTLVLDGSSLAGDRTSLLLNFPDWDQPVEVDSLTWGVQVTPESLQAVVQNTAGPETLVPGMYGAIVQVIHRRPTATGETRDFSYQSNEAPFAISPRINLITVNGSGAASVDGRLFQAAGILADAIKVYVGNEQLNVGTAGSLLDGQYAVISPTQIDLQLPAGLTSGDWVPFRLIINGAELAPNWIQVP